MVRFMFETAARIDQAVSLEPNDLRPSENKVRVKAQEGHPVKWITVSPEMMDELLALPEKRPKNRKTGKFMKRRVLGYGSSTGYNNRWKTICIRPSSCGRKALIHPALDKCMPDAAYFDKLKHEKRHEHKPNAS